MIVKDKPNKVTATLKVKVTAEFYDDETTAESLRFCVEQDLEAAGYDVEVTLLKKARVMALEEAQGTDYVWYESRLTGCVFPASISMSADTWHGDYTTDVQQIGYGGYKFVLDKEYGSAWRCWDKRPTDEQREAVKWDDND